MHPIDHQMHVRIVRVSMHGGHILMIFHPYRFHRLAGSLKGLFVCRVLAFLPVQRNVINRVFDSPVHVGHSQHFTPCRVTI